MAQIDDLVKLVDDERLRRELEQAVKKLRKGREFGLVFEEHIPEVIALPDLPLEVGGWAQLMVLKPLIVTRRRESQEQETDRNTTT